MIYATILKTKTTFRFKTNSSLENKAETKRKVENAMVTMGHSAEDYAITSRDPATREYSVPVEVEVLDCDGFELEIKL